MREHIWRRRLRSGAGAAHELGSAAAGGRRAAGTPEPAAPIRTAAAPRSRTAARGHVTLLRARAGRERGAEPRTAPPEPAAGGRGTSPRYVLLPSSSLHNFWWRGEVGGRELQCISAPPPGRGRGSSRRPRAPRHRRPQVPPGPVAYRVVHPPHEDAEQRVAGPEQLHFLRHEVFLLGLGLTRHDGGDGAGGRHGAAGGTGGAAGAGSARQPRGRLGAADGLTAAGRRAHPGLCRAEMAPLARRGPARRGGAAPATHGGAPPLRAGAGRSAEFRFSAPRCARAAGSGLRGAFSAARGAAAGRGCSSLLRFPGWKWIAKRAHRANRSHLRHKWTPQETT